MKLVNVQVIKDELERLTRNYWFLSSAEAKIRCVVYMELSEWLDELEVKEEVLDENGKSKLMRKCVKAAYKRGYDMGVLQTTNKMIHNTKEVDLEKHLKEDIENVYFDLNGVAVKGATYYLTVEDIKEIAKHFFELGLKAHKL